MLSLVSLLMTRAVTPTATFSNCLWPKVQPQASANVKNRGEWELCGTGMNIELASRAGWRPLGVATMGFLYTLCGVNTSMSKKGGKKTRMQNLGLMVNTTGLYRIQTKRGAAEQQSSRAAEREVSISAIIGQRSCLACTQLTNSGAFVDSSWQTVRWKPVPASRPLEKKSYSESQLFSNGWTVLYHHSSPAPYPSTYRCPNH